MKIEDIVGVVELVRELNGKMEDAADSGLIPILHMETDGHEVNVVYLGSNIWQSTDDVRDIVDDKPEDLRAFLINAINEYSSAIGRVRI
jgi:hypothetical protein